MSKSGLLVILMKLSYPLYHLCKCTEKTKSGYNYLFTFGGLGGKKMLADGKPLFRTIKTRPCSPRDLIERKCFLKASTQTMPNSKSASIRVKTLGAFQGHCHFQREGKIECHLRKKIGFQISLVPVGMNHPGLTIS